MTTLELGVLVSGNGSNLQAILDAIAGGTLDARIRLVISNRPEAFALERARRASVPSKVIAHRSFGQRGDFDAALVQALREASVSTVVLAGFMRVLTPVFLEAFPSRVINIHPALLPAFPGVDAQRQALEYGVKFTGCTVHFVDGGTDTGPIIAQAVVPVEELDTEETLKARILEEEHRLLVDVLRAFAEDRVAIAHAAGDARPKVMLRAAAAATGPPKGAPR
jgi:phosphoribosylglycinamide formyltransferase-1